MIKFTVNLVRVRENWKLVQVLFVSTLATVSVASTTLSWSDSAYAQNSSVSEAEVKKYAEVLLKLEPNRQRAYTEIKQIIGSEPQTIACNDSNSLNSLPGNARSIAEKYCKDSLKIVESHLPIPRFNEITQALRSNNGLEKRIRNQMIAIQNNSNSR